MTETLVHNPREALGFYAPPNRTVRPDQTPRFGGGRILLDPPEAGHWATSPTCPPRGPWSRVRDLSPGLQGRGRGAAEASWQAACYHDPAAVALEVAWVSVGRTSPPEESQNGPGSKSYRP